MLRNATLKDLTLYLLLAYDRNEPYRMGHLEGDDFVVGLPVARYPHLPNAAVKEINFPAHQAVKAMALVLTTQVTPDPSYPPVVPIFLMERPVLDSQPANENDLILVSSTDLVNQASALGYSYLGRQGYLYEWCTGLGCTQPPGTEALHLKCNTSSTVKDCAVFLESRRAEFEAPAHGYTALFPGASHSELGFAYTLADTDGDGLVDAMEYIIGTSINHVDSDGDGTSDADEYPLASAPFSDPCVGPEHVVNYCTRPDPKIFKNSFETGGVP